MKSEKLFEIAKEYATDRIILELEAILKSDNKDLSTTIKKRLEELYKINL